MAKFQPMLADICEDIEALRLPVLASPKLDGIRALVVNGVLLSRNLKPIANEHTQKLFGRAEFNGLDGELIVGAPHGRDVMNRTSSGVMSREGVPDVQFHIFDKWDHAGGYAQRHDALRALVVQAGHERCAVLDQHLFEAAAPLLAFETATVAAGYEGVMLRGMCARAAEQPYKFGRSTVREGLLLKLIRRRTLEARVIGFVEQLHNANEQTRDERGYAKRSKVKDGLVPNGKLGALVAETLETGLQFEIGSGFTDAQRVDYWQRRETLLDCFVTVEYRDLTKDNVPRFPVFKGWRDVADMSGQKGLLW